MAFEQHLKGQRCAETRGPDSDVGGPAVGRRSAEAEGRLTSYGPTEITRPRSAEARGPDLDAWMSVAHLSACHTAQLQCPMVPRGLEPRTLRLLAVRSNQLSYETTWEA